jgi:hypothetical protein
MTRTGNWSVEALGYRVWDALKRVELLLELDKEKKA